MRWSTSSTKLNYLGGNDVTALQETVSSYAAGWMQTFSGKKFTPLTPKLEDIHFIDIAAPLARVCRYSGHCLRFYSVAEHCVLASRIAPDQLRLTMLMHDASEAYLTDMPRPIKGHIKGYYEAEEKLAAMIAERFGTIHPLPEEVKRIDAAMLDDERRQNMAHMDVEPKDWGNVVKGPGTKLQFWDPDRAQSEFITAFYQYGGVS